MAMKSYGLRSLSEGLEKSYSGYVDDGKHTDPACFVFMLGGEAPKTYEEEMRFRTGVRMTGNRDNLVALFLSCMQNKNFHDVALESVAALITQDAETFQLFREMCNVMIDTPPMTVSRVETDK